MRCASAVAQVVSIDEGGPIDHHDPRLLVTGGLFGFGHQQVLHELVGHRLDPAAPFRGAGDPADAVSLRGALHKVEEAHEVDADGDRHVGPVRRLRREPLHRPGDLIAEPSKRDGDLSRRR